MPGLSLFTKNAVLNAIFKKTAFTVGDIYISMHTGDPGDSGALEITHGVGAYQRVQLSPDGNSVTHTNWNAIATVSTFRRVTNAGAITFPQATGNWASGLTLTHWGAFDASTGGNFIVAGDIEDGGVICLSGNRLEFDAGNPGPLYVEID